MLVERFGEPAPVQQTKPEEHKAPRARPAPIARSRLRSAPAPPASAGDARRRRTLARPHASSAPKSKAIRPTADRLREALFNILIHSVGDPVTGARVLDLFAGTGALGIEALSRGAAFALFVDDGAEARALLRENVAALGLGGTSQDLSPRRHQARPSRNRSSRSRLPFSIRLMGKGSRLPR